MTFKLQFTHPFKDKYPAKDGWVIDEKAEIKVQNLYCCGVKELHGIQGRWRFWCKGTEVFKYEDWTIDTLLPAIQEAYIKACQGRDRPFWIFTDNRKDCPTGVMLANYIEANGLGSVHRSERCYNYNSGNSVVVYLWTVNAEALKAWKCSN